MITTNTTNNVVKLAQRSASEISRLETLAQRAEKRRAEFPLLGAKDGFTAALLRVAAPSGISIPDATDICAARFPNSDEEMRRTTARRLKRYLRKEKSLPVESRTDRTGKTYYFIGAPKRKARKTPSPSPSPSPSPENIVE